MRLLISSMLLLASASAFAARTVVELDAAGYKAATANPTKMEAEKAYYTYKLVPFTDWARQSPTEYQALNLYPGFVEPQVTKIKYGVESLITEKMIMFVAEGKMILNKAPGQVSAAKLIQLDKIRQFDTALKQNDLAPNQLMPLVAGKGQISAFQWCSQDSILKPAREKNLSYLMPKGRTPWCSDTARSKCVESCFLFSKGYNAPILALNQITDEAEQKDYGIAFQSEIRHFTGDQDSGSPVPLQKLTGLNSSIRGGLEQTSFYFNQIFEYAKVLVVLQDADPTKTIATVYFVFGIKQRTWDTHEQVRTILMGKSKLFNSTTGLTSGLPPSTQAMLNSLGQLIEN